MLLVKVAILSLLHLQQVTVNDVDITPARLKPKLTFSGAIRIRAVTGSWQVWRRFSQFAELDHELKAKGHGEALQHGRASLPSTLRLPLGLQIEGDERQPTLDAYLERLMAHQRLRHSDQLMFFVSQTEVHRRLWRRAMGMAAPEDAEQQLSRCE